MYNKIVLYSQRPYVTHAMVAGSSLAWEQGYLYPSSPHPPPSPSTLTLHLPPLTLHLPPLTHPLFHSSTPSESPSTPHPSTLPPLHPHPSPFHPSTPPLLHPSPLHPSPFTLHPSTPPPLTPPPLHPQHTTHLELSEGAMLSVISSFTPYSDFNQSPRNMYQCQVGVARLPGGRGQIWGRA